MKKVFILENNKQIKKRIMFNKESDYYFITYNLFLILDSLNCYEGKSTFNDYRKIIYIIPFISENELLKIITNGHNLKSEDIKKIEDVYINAKLREPILKSILFTLENRGYLIIVKNKDTLGIKLTKKGTINEFLKHENFTFERENIITFKSNYKRLSSIKFETLLEKIWKERGAIIWGI